MNAELTVALLATRTETASGGIQLFSHTLAAQHVAYIRTLLGSASSVHGVHIVHSLALPLSTVSTVVVSQSRTFMVHVV